MVECKKKEKHSKHREKKNRHDNKQIRLTHFISLINRRKRTSVRSHSVSASIIRVSSPRGLKADMRIKTGNKSGSPYNNKGMSVFSMNSYT